LKITFIINFWTHFQCDEKSAFLCDMLRYTTQCYVMLRYATSYCEMLRYAVKYESCSPLVISKWEQLKCDDVVTCSPEATGVE
jgi:hypothetical protein